MKMIKLYHYSSNNFNGYIKPKYFGENSYSRSSKRESLVNRSFFYLTRNKKEILFNGCRFLYVAEINENKLYNLNKDILKLTENKRIKDIYAHVKRLGYKGLIGNNGFKVAVLFYTTKAQKKII